MEERILFASALSLETDADEAAGGLAARIQEQLGEAQVDLALVFLSTHFTHDVRKIAQRLRAALNPRTILGCTAEGVIGEAREVEDQPAISLLAAHFPQVDLVPFWLQPSQWPKTLLDEDEFCRAVGATEDTRVFILLGDPFSSPVDDVLHAFNQFYPDIPVVGGMASGALRAYGNTLFVDDHVTNVGLVGVAVGGPVDVEVIVSQGCRPIWQPFIVQKAHKNIIFSLEGQPPLAWIQELAPELPEEDRELMQGGLFVGRAIHPGEDNPGRGDFLIRGVVGIDQQRGAIAIGDYVQEGERVQFHLRDAATAQEDLEMLLVPQVFRQPPDGGLLFSCNGRGTRLYDHPDGDISIIRENLGDAHLAGFFAAGELGPIGGMNFLHGHTASLILFRSAPKI